MVTAPSTPGSAGIHLRPPPPQGPPTDQPISATPRLAALGRSLVQPETTPGWLRLWGLILAAALILFAVTGTLAGLSARSSTATIQDDTAPSLIGVQDLLSSVAEANAAATGAFLSGSAGTESRAQRNLYLDAVRRSTAEAERVSSLVGDSEAAHQALQNIGANLVVYSGEIESSRTANLAGVSTARDQLRGALDITGTDVASSVVTITAEARADLDRQTDRGLVIGIVAVGLGSLALLLLLLFQVRLTTRTNRVLNLPLVAASILTAIAVVVLASGLLTRNTALSNARSGGYDSIESTAEIQAAAFAAQTALSLELIGGQATEIQPLLDNVRSGIDRAKGRADSTREEAAVNLLEQRFTRYETTVSAIRASAAVAAGDPANSAAADATAAFQGEGLSTFNGLNTSIESVLFDNRTQFVAGVGDAADAANRLPVYLIVLPLLAALAALLGIQRRLREYS